MSASTSKTRHAAEKDSVSLRNKLLSQPSLLLAAVVAAGVTIAWGSAWWIRQWNELSPLQPTSLPYAAGAVELSITTGLIALLVYIGLSEIAKTGIHKPGQTEQELAQDQGEYAFDKDKLLGITNQNLASLVTTAIKAELASAKQNGGQASIETAVDQAMSKWNGEPKLFDVVKYDLDLLNNRINSEYAGVSEKVGWLVTSQAFLVSGFMTLLNNASINSVERLLLMLGIGGIGLSGATALSIGIFFGHAWCEFLKEARGKIEKLAYDAFHIPRTGVPASYGAHFLGHFATKLLASLSIAGWATLLILVGLNKLQIEPQPQQQQVQQQASGSPQNKAAPTPSQPSQ